MIECLSYRKKPGVVLQEGKQTTLSLLLKHALAYLSIQQTIAMGLQWSSDGPLHISS